MNIEYRPATPYMVICKWITWAEIPRELPPLIGKVYAWLKKKQIDPAGSPFFEYRVMTADKMHVCVGFPLREPLEGDDTIHAGAFPEGDYAVTTYVGAYGGLHAANQALNDSFQASGYRQRFMENGGAVHSGSRTEFYHSDPATEPDQNKWRTDIAVWVERA